MSILANSMKVRVATRAMMLAIALIVMSIATSAQKSQNHPPTVTLMASPTSLCYGGEVKLFADAKDLDGDKLAYKYTPDTGQIIGEGRNVRWKLGGMGDYEVKVEVNDGRGGVATASARIIIFELCECPSITMNGSADVAKMKPLITFSLAMSGGQIYRKPAYSWTVTAGKIIKGEGTPSITVDVAGIEADEITATVKISGLAPSCQNMASFTMKNPLHKSP